MQQKQTSCIETDTPKQMEINQTVFILSNNIVHIKINNKTKKLEQYSGKNSKFIFDLLKINFDDFIKNNRFKKNKKNEFVEHVKTIIITHSNINKIRGETRKQILMKEKLPELCDSQETLSADSFENECDSDSFEDETEFLSDVCYYQETLPADSFEDETKFESLPDFNNDKKLSYHYDVLNSNDLFSNEPELELETDSDDKEYSVTHLPFPEYESPFAFGTLLF